MDAKLTQDELQAIKERAEKAAIGEWIYDETENEVRCGDYLIARDTDYKEDAEFIVAARQDIPKLVAEVEMLNAIIRTKDRQIEGERKGSRKAYAEVERVHSTLKTIAYECDELIADGYIEESGVVDIRNIAREALE